MLQDLPPEDGEMNEKTLPYRHRIRNSSPGSLRPSTVYLSVTEAPYNIECERGRDNLFLSNLNARAELGPRSPTFQAKRFNHYTRAPFKTKIDLWA